MVTAPAVVNPETGELVTLDQVTQRMDTILQTLDGLDSIGPKIKTLGLIEYHYDRLYHATISTSEASAIDRRKAEAVKRCNETPYSQVLPEDRWQLNGDLGNPDETLGAAKARLRVQVKAMEAVGHNLRSQLSGWQSMSSNLRTLYNGPDLGVGHGR